MDTPRSSVEALITDCIALNEQVSILGEQLLKVYNEYLSSQVYNKSSTMKQSFLELENVRQDVLRHLKDRLASQSRFNNSREIFYQNPEMSSLEEIEEAIEYFDHQDYMLSIEWKVDALEGGILDLKKTFLRDLREVKELEGVFPMIIEKLRHLGDIDEASYVRVANEVESVRKTLQEIKGGVKNYKTFIKNLEQFSTQLQEQLNSMKAELLSHMSDHPLPHLSMPSMIME